MLSDIKSIASTFFCEVGAPKSPDDCHYDYNQFRIPSEWPLAAERKPRSRGDR